MKATVIVLDSVGIGAASDAGAYGDAGSATLQHMAAAIGGVSLPVMKSMGLGSIHQCFEGGLPIRGVDQVEHPAASFGAMQELSEGKDTITGHWEIAGLEMRPGFHTFPPEYPSFPSELIEAFERQTGRTVIGNKAANGVAIIEELGEEQMKSGAWIAYTSADSVFQIAANVDIIPLDELYTACETARELCNPYRIGRVIARPFSGEPGRFERTEDRRDYAYLPEEKTVLERLVDEQITVLAVGKIEDIYVHRGITESEHAGNMYDAMKAVEQFSSRAGDALIFANFIDFDMLYGHRRDPQGYARALQDADAWLGRYMECMSDNDVLIVTADHGNDPTFKGSDHTREYVPLLVYCRSMPPRNLGLRKGFYDIAQSLASFFGIHPLPRGQSFLPRRQR